MASRTPTEAASAFLDEATRWLSCVTQSNQLLIDGYSTTTPRNIVTPGGRAILLRSPGSLQLDVRIRAAYRRVEAGGRLWELATSSYALSLQTPDERELLAYHWHPEPGFVSHPHLHVNGELVVNRRMHLPTGPVGLNDVLAFLIREYEVTPLRADWQDVLAPG